jgi:hypothetical protein
MNAHPHVASIAVPEHQEQLDMDADERVDPEALSDPTSEVRDLDWKHRTRHIGSEIALSAFFVTVGAGLMVAARSIRSGSIPDPITSAGMPRLTGILLIVFGGVMLARFVGRVLRDRATYRVASQGDNDEPGHPSSFVRPLAVVVVSLVWTWAVARIGYFLATPLLIAAVLRIMDVRSRGKLIAVPLGFTVVVWILFAEVLGIGFPLGFMDTPLRRAGLVG